MDIANTDIAVKMTMILATMVALLYGLTLLQTPSANKSSSSFLPSAKSEPSRYAYELFVACYTPIWITGFGAVVVSQVYENFTAWSYLQVCGGLALPLLLQPIILPSGGFNSPDAQRPLLERYCFKANVWLAIYSFIGNYWYTHYFYSVLKASYTMPAHRLNNVPIAMFFATHFYFCTYHFFANALLRKVVTTYQASFLRTVLFVAVVLVFSYFTAFMETLSISAYPYWEFEGEFKRLLNGMFMLMIRFSLWGNNLEEEKLNLFFVSVKHEDRHMAYTVGSAFYGIYFLVSFPAFFYFDQHIDNSANAREVTLWDTIVSSCGYGMMILCLLDFVRLHLDIPLIVGADFS